MRGMRSILKGKLVALIRVGAVQIEISVAVGGQVLCGAWPLSLYETLCRGKEMPSSLSNKLSRWIKVCQRKHRRHLSSKGITEKRQEFIQVYSRYRGKHVDE